MPLRSQAQAAYLKNNDPAVFKKFVADTPAGTKLPRRVKKEKRVLRSEKRPYER
jgi:hypothetical protein